jgi:hypothetical protein
MLLTPDKVRPSLTDRLTDEEINATLTRLKEMRKCAEKLHPHYVVENWKNWRAPETGQNASQYLKAQKMDHLFARDFSRSLEGKF